MKTPDSAVDESILAALEERGGYVSGEELSRRLGLSRAAVWKRIRLLRDGGYGIRARTRRGYLLVEKPDVLSGREVGRNLDTRIVGRELYTFDDVTSTNDLAYEAAVKGAGEGAAVIADSQTRGRGRLNRSWISPGGKNLYLSVVLRPVIPPSLVSILTYMGAVAAAEALEEDFALGVELKWPNDVLVRGRKLAGLLNEVKAEADRVDFVVLGFGVNLNMGEEDFPHDVLNNATSVMMETGRRVSRVRFARSLLKSIDSWYRALLVHGSGLALARWEDAAAIRGKTVEVSSFGRIHRGVAEGLDQNGALILRKGEGEVIRIVAGDLREEEGR
ncbi:MAG: biotin--[acetyl-CoA-carboxylase] ligase [Deltaproteobacteria bacterium]|nr:biotin--[acetyl-CoA-carboxylase] ligase [Deltaproteobacteria bacterium]